MAYTLRALSAACLAAQLAPAARADPWSSAVSAQIRDAEHAFVEDGGSFTAASPEQGIAGRFDQEGARLAQEEDAISVRAVGWGRAGAVVRVEPMSPALGDCVDGREDPEGRCVQRLEYSGEGLTEWWAGGAEGFEQGWTVQGSPAGEGPLVVVVAVAGATVTGEDGDLWLDGDSGGEWIVSGLVAWDADGKALDARFDVVAGGFRVAVADSGARFPVEIDPVYTTVTATLTGEETGDYFGEEVSGAGDVNGDGYDDVIVGADGYHSITGRAYVYAQVLDVDGDEDGYYASEGCDDADDAVNPGATEVCNEKDDDCDGRIDRNAIDALIWYADADGDGYTDLDDTVTACDAPDGYATATEDDCDDSDATVSPGASEIPGDGIDQDCDGVDSPIGGDTSDDTSSGNTDDIPKPKEGCTCATPNPARTAWSLLALLALASRRRRVR